MKRKRTAKILSLIIAAYIVFTMLPVAAFADEGTGDSTYTATLNVQLDGASFDDFDDDLTLKFSDDESIVVSMTGTGSTRTASLQNGEWKVYLNDVDTGETITVTDAPASGTLDMFSIDTQIITQGTATDGEIDIDGIASNRLACFKGEALTFTASGYGAASYDYDWSGTHNGNSISGTGNTYSIASVQGKVYIICTITGSSTPATIDITGFIAIPNMNAGIAGDITNPTAVGVITHLQLSYPHAQAMHSGTLTIPGLSLVGRTRMATILI